MSDPFLAEIKIVGFNFAPHGWAFCDGQILMINQNQSLYSLLGTTFGGDGRTSFGLPDLRGRTPAHVDPGNNSFDWGGKGGEETHALTESEIPSHSHTAFASTNADTDEPPGAFPGQTEDATYHNGSGASLVNLGSSTVSTAGAAGHENMQPFLALHFCIALQGTFPSRN